MKQYEDFSNHELEEEWQIWFGQIFSEESSRNVRLIEDEMTKRGTLPPRFVKNRKSVK